MLPDGDTVICDPTATIPTRHLLTATAAQNYGLNTYRIRQPFDFAGRTGTIKLDVDLTNGGLHGWPAIAIAEDPSPTPSFDFPERGSGPRNGFEIEFMNGWCNTPNTVMPVIYRYRDYLESPAPETVPPASYDCGLPHAMVAKGSLNHVEIYLTQTHVEVWVSDASPDGVTFPNFQRLYAGDLDLPFSRGYVSLIARNHATIKYGGGLAWIQRWDNVGFDGPVVGGWREASVPDALEPTADGEGLRTGYTVPAAENGESVSVQIPAVSLAGATSARLALSAQYPWFEWNGVNHPPTFFNLRYRLNGGAWHDRFVNDVEANAFQSFSGDSGAAGRRACSARSSSWTSPSCAKAATRWSWRAPTSGPVVPDRRRRDRPDRHHAASARSSLGRRRCRLDAPRPDPLWRPERANALPLQRGGVVAERYRLHRERQIAATPLTHSSRTSLGSAKWMSWAVPAITC